TLAALRFGLAGDVEQPDMGEQAGEDGCVHPVEPSGRVVAVQAELRAGLAQLGVQVLPLPYAQKIEVLAAAQPAEGVAGEVAAALPQVGPQPVQRRDVRAIWR